MAYLWWIFPLKRVIFHSYYSPHGFPHVFSTQLPRTGGAKGRQRTLEDATEDGTLNVGDIAAWYRGIVKNMYSCRWKWDIPRDMCRYVI
jgi:hypothetical protein